MRRWFLFLSIPILAWLVWAAPSPIVADNDPGEPIEEQPWDSCQGCFETIQYYENGRIHIYECAALPELQTEGKKNCQTTSYGCTGNTCTVLWA